MEIWDLQIDDIVRLKDTGKFLGGNKSSKTDRMTYYELDEDRRRLKLEDYEKPVYFIPTPQKGDLEEVPDSEEKAAFIQELNQQIVMSNIGAVGLLIQQIKEAAFGALPVVKPCLDWQVDKEALDEADDNIKLLASIYEKIKLAGELLHNAAIVDTVQLKRFAISEKFI
jgi:hypothetical protein